MSVGLSIIKKTSQLFTNSHYSNYEKELCIICFEDGFKKYNYEDWRNYYKKCQCKFFIHEECFNEWYNINPNCPICRKPIFLRNIETQYKYYINEFFEFALTCFWILIVAILWLCLVSTLIEVIFIY